MGIFIAWFLFWVAGGTLGPVQYHPEPSDVSSVPAIHEASEGGHQ